MSELSKNDYLMILALEQDPLMSLKELSEKVNLSWPTVKKRYQDVISRGILRSPTAFPYIEELGLVRYTVLSIVPNFNAMTKLESACNIFPYSKYRGRMIGNNIGVFAQFDIPIGENAENNLEEFFDQLKSRQIITEYSIKKSARIRHESQSDLSHFNVNSASWDFKWDKWFENIRNSKIKELPLPNDLNEDFSEFTKLRFDILASLSGNAALKQSDLMDLFNLSRTEASRQYNFIQNNYIRTVRLNYDRDTFDLTEYYVFHLKGVSVKEQAALYSNVQDMPTPFSISIEIFEENEVMLWGTMSLNHSNAFIFNLWKQFPNLDVWRLSTNDQGAAQYHFFPPNYDWDKNKWRDDVEYMINEPLRELDNLEIEWVKD